MNGIDFYKQRFTHSEKDVCLSESYPYTLCFVLYRLDQELDYAPLLLGKIADSMYEWEGAVADHLGLRQADVAAIKTKHPGELKLQT